MSSTARGALRVWPRRMDTPYLFAHRDGTPIRDVKTAWAKLCEEAKVSDARFHDLRHSAVTRLLEAGVDIRTIMAITGHKSVARFKRYSHPSDSHLKTAVEGLAGDPTRVKTRDSA